MNRIPFWREIPKHIQAAVDRARLDLTAAKGKALADEGRLAVLTIANSKAEWHKDRVKRFAARCPEEHDWLEVSLAAAPASHKGLRAVIEWLAHR